MISKILLVSQKKYLKKHCCSSASFKTVAVHIKTLIWKKSFNQLMKKSARRWCATARRNEQVNLARWKRNQAENIISGFVLFSSLFLRDSYNKLKSRKHSKAVASKWTSAKAMTLNFKNNSNISTLSRHCLESIFYFGNFHLFQLTIFMHNIFSISRMFMSIVCLAFYSIGRHRVKHQHCNKEIYERLFVFWQQI